MGGGITKPKRVITLILVGLDNSGKTTFIKSLKTRNNNSQSTQAFLALQETAPTVGYNQEKFTRGEFNYNVFDMSGQSKYREMWNAYCKEIEGIVFVLDSSDSLRLQVAANELAVLLEIEAIHNRPVPILFLANKSDLPGAMTTENIESTLHLEELSQERKWTVVSTNALKGTNVDAAFGWLSQQVIKAFPSSARQ